MSGKRGQIESFFRTLLLGDFEEDQNFAAQIVGGLISMIPVLDQVMDARDITGTLFRINQRGGFNKAGTDELVNLGFAAFGAIPEVGSAFKTVFKPLWRERRAAKGAVHSGLQAVEGLLGLGKGGAIRWVRQELLGKWGPRTQAAILQVDAAMGACIELMEFMATASGWKDWLIPDSVQQLARDLLPGMRQLRTQIKAPLERASKEIREFLEDLLGEQAAAVVMAVGQRAAMASATPGTRTRTGHNAADIQPRGHIPARQPAKKVGGRAESDARKGGGPLHAAVQVTRKAYQNIAKRQKGLIGEHMADYHELKRLGGHWPHDNAKGHWSPEHVKKLNVDQRPVNLSEADLPKVTETGIDAVWQHGQSYTVTEAKMRESAGRVYGFGRSFARSGKGLQVSGLNPSQELLHYLLSDSDDERGAEYRMVQMSSKWVANRATGEKMDQAAKNALQSYAADRRVVFVTLESDGALDHIQALADLYLPEKAASEKHPHPTHGITKEWGATDIDAVVKARDRARRERARTNKNTDQKPGNKTTRLPPPRKNK
ncbi:hypothetical protein RAB70_17675 [Xanthomonas sontii]|uniref:hypothetical protein n=1 Tax=Xanthomonas sontii TaxID=2650745 RepID=UPI0011E3E593|nr:hypothetical protein [Xanthomonas sontii]MDQ7758985.1 hypothetical protein [Xanthomonas sontii]TYD33894.1 hypothetical protein CEK63_13200 [Xanthomonas sontii]UZK07831.1 hypothetical protein CJ027_014410 [Xanthomonas sontii]